MKHYNSKMISVHSWPSAEQLSDGIWKRRFVIRLKTPLTAMVDLGKLSSEIMSDIVASALRLKPNEVSISIDLMGPQEVTASMISQLDDQSDEILFITWRMLEDIDRFVGTIDTIEGEPRALWPPWNLHNEGKLPGS